jgi:hypothetical protein
LACLRQANLVADADRGREDRLQIKDAPFAEGYIHTEALAHEGREYLELHLAHDA